MQLPISPIKLFDQPTLYIRTTRHVPFTNKFLHHQLANRFHFLTDKYLFIHSFIHLLFATASFPSSLKANSSAFACKRFIALSLSLSLDSTNLSLLNVWSGFVWLITCCNHDNWIPIHNFQHSSNTSLFLFLPSYYITYLSHLSCDNWNFWQCLHVVFTEVLLDTCVQIGVNFCTPNPMHTDTTNELGVNSDLTLECFFLQLFSI